MSSPGTMPDGLAARHASHARSSRHRAWTGVRLAHLAIACLALLLLAAGSVPAAAVKPIAVDGNLERLEITLLSDAYDGRGDTLQIETAPGLDGAAGRMSVRAQTAGTSPKWLVFALHNPTDKTIELLLTGARYDVIGSGMIWPDLDFRRIDALTHSAGYAPERVKSDRADIYRLTIERGQTVTYVAEIASERMPRVYLWKPSVYEQRQREGQLFNGIMLGVTGLLAVFLTAVFAANHKSIFPSAALVSWCVLALLCVDFGFWHKLFQMRPEDNAQYRAAAEAAVAASLVIFLFSFLRVNLWNGFARMLFLVWVAGQIAIVAIAVLDPRLAATVARMSMGMIGLLGGLIVLFLSVRGIDRALALLPTWVLFIVWLFGAAVTITGRLTGDVVIFGLVSGLVLIMLLISFTVTQFAFRSNEPVYGSNPNEQQLRLAAMDRAGVAIFEWSARRDEIKLDPEVEVSLGLGPGEMPTRLKDFMSLLHPADRELLQITLDGIKERHGGRIGLDLRLRHADSTFRWFEFDGAHVPTSDRRALRCVGVVRDVTDARRAQERLLHDAVHDSLTGLPNRELLLDRLQIALDRAKAEPALRPTVIFFDIDKFKSVNSSFGVIVGDSILITAARRLARNLKPHDTLARIGGDQFALLLLAPRDPRDLAGFAEGLRLSLRSPIRIAGQEIVLTSSIGVAIADGSGSDARDLLREAEVAMHWAKRSGSDRIEVFKSEMRAEKDDRVAIESDLRRAIETGQLSLLYQPIVALSSEELVGFEALVRWEHPRLGFLSPADFVPIAEETDLIVQLGTYVLGRAVTDLARWQKELPRPEHPLFISVNVSSRQLIKPDLVQEVRHAVGRAVVPAGSLRLEITESLVMENPEQATHILELLRDAGVQLALDDFGTGYSSLAYLNRFPFDTIKIDQALVQSSSLSDSNAIIVRSIVALAHELGKRVVAEGVEAEEDAAFLRSIGCEYAQGFYYGEPMAEEDIARLLRLIRKADRRMRRRGLVRGKDKAKPGDDNSGGGRMPTGPAQPPDDDGPRGPRSGATQPPSRPAAPTNGHAPPPGSGPAGPGMPHRPPGGPPSRPHPVSGPPPVTGPSGAPHGMSRPIQPGGPNTGPPSGPSGGPPPMPFTPGHPPSVPGAGPVPIRTGPPASVPPMPHQLPPHAPPQSPRPGTGPVGQTGPQSPPAAQPPSGVQPQAPRSPRRANIAALSPVVAASLAKLAGSTARAAVERDIARQRGEGEPNAGPPTGKPDTSDAAE